MPPHRKILVYAVLGAIVVLPVVGKRVNIDLWPFSRYSMYAVSLTTPQLSRLRVYLVPRNDARGEIALADPTWMYPFDNSRLSAVLDVLRHRPDAPQCLQRALADIARRYETRRRAGAHTGPALQGLRLYDALWQMQPDAGNVDSPEQRTLVTELRLREADDSNPRP